MWALTFVAFDPLKAYHHHAHRMRRFNDGRWMIMLDLIQKSPATPVVSRVTIGTPKPQIALEEEEGTQTPSLEPIVVRMQSHKSDALLPSDLRGQIVVDLWEQKHGASLEFE